MADGYYTSYYGSLPPSYEFPTTGTVYMQPAVVAPAVPHAQQPTGQSVYSLSVPPEYSQILQCGSYAISHEVPPVQHYSNMPPVVTVQYEIQPPIAGVQYSTPVATANYGTVAQHTIAHYAAQSYTPTSLESSVPAVVSTVNYHQFCTDPVTSQYIAPLQSPYCQAVDTQRTTVPLYDPPNVYTTPATQIFRVPCAQNYELANQVVKSNVFSKSAFHSDFKSYVPQQSHHPFRLQSPSSILSSVRQQLNHQYKSVSRSRDMRHRPRAHIDNSATSTSSLLNNSRPTAPASSEQLRHSKPLPRSSSNTNVNNVKRHTFESSRHKEISKPIQLHHCSICKLTCAGKQLYQEHLESVKHQKMAQYNESNSEAVRVETKVKVTHLSCEKCHVFCGDADSYAAHVRSNEHQKVLKSHSLGNTESSAVKSSVSTTKAVLASDPDAIVHPDIQPIGLDMIKENVNKTGLFCKLCDREIELSIGKMQHCKTRGHRQQYKNKVDSKFFVEAKPVRSLIDGMDYLKHKDIGVKGKMKSRLLEEQWRMMQERLQFEAQLKELDQQHTCWKVTTQRNADTYNDNCVNSKHADVYPTESELTAIEHLVSTCEKCLKLISDNIIGSDKEVECADGNSKVKRLITGVMRVGHVAKGLLIRGDQQVELVLLCMGMPTRSLLQRVVAEFPKQLAKIANAKFDIRLLEHCAAFTVGQVAVGDNLSVMCLITLTSPIVREQVLVNEPREEVKSKMESADALLDHGSCLKALAAVRRAKWFQAKAIGLPSCIIILRVLRAVRELLAGWSALTQWAVELLVEKCLGSVGEISLTPGSGLRRVFEAVASGILLPDGPGLYDPCEKDSVNVIASLTDQQREEITASAQRALRQIAFRKVNDVLGVAESNHGQLHKHRKRSNSSVSDKGCIVKLIKTEEPSHVVQSVPVKQMDVTPS